MILSAIAALGSLGAAIYSGIQSNRRAKDAQNQLERARQDNERFYRSEAARPVTTRSDYLAMLGNQREMLNTQYRRARATAAVAGGTDAQLAMMQQGANQTMADTTAQMAAQTSSRKDNLRMQGNSVNNQYRQQQYQAMSNAADAVAAAGGQVTRAASGLAAADLNTLSDDLSVFGLNRGSKKEPSNQIS